MLSTYLWKLPLGEVVPVCGAESLQSILFMDFAEWPIFDGLSIA